MALTDRQQQFVTHYVALGNATRAAIAAGYSKKGAEVTGSKLLRNAKVRESVAAARKAQQRRVEVTSDMVIEGLLTEARRDEEGASHTARVTAWRTIADLLKLFDKERDTDDLPTLSISLPPDVDDE